MMEIRFHGRGGQGIVLAAKILADAVLRSGRGECLAIPEFGVERRGAPVTAYLRISDRKIVLRSRIYEPDAVVLFDPTLAADPGITRGLKPGGRLLINTPKPAEELSSRWSDYRVFTIPARRIAWEHRLGSASNPLVNTTMCGAVAAIFNLADLASLEAAIRESVPAKMEENVAAAREAHQLAKTMEGLHAVA
ncbi:MAG: 2-oxoacid:acceptor oxidoreductase family protein [Elusimicrobia bacterium]|nr:2-oxoacid:acceptor oxidoreductase family protein [Elusimicrobiota bacterium]